LNKFNTCVLPPYGALGKAPLVVEIVVGPVVLDWFCGSMCKSAVTTWLHVVYKTSEKVHIMII
jgi:hypothetical protein